MAIFLLLVLGVIALVAIIATFVQVARDGYRAVPTRPDLLRHP
jgi:hypothetical protein